MQDQIPGGKARGTAPARTAKEGSGTDSPAGYGIVSRTLHWLMAACFAWHFAGALLYVTVPEAGVTKFVGSTHFTMGFTLLVLVLLRGAWGLLNIRRRPPHPGRLGRLATMGHLEHDLT